MVKIYFDLDNVLRETSWFCYPTEWDYKIDGVCIVNYITQHLDLLRNAPPTKYLEVYLKYKFPILTNQPPEWREVTEEWIKKWIGNAEVIYVSSAEQKLDYLVQHTYLVDDYPFFTGKKTERIILVDRPYNRGIEYGWRVYWKEHLENLIEYLLKNG